MSRTKYLALLVKKSPTDGSGKFTAVVSTFGGDPDADGDVIAEGAYDKTIEEWRAKGDWPTVWYMHGYEDPLNAIGKLQDIRIEDKELVVDGQLDLNNERAVRVYEAMLTGKLNEFSIGYAIRDEELVKDAEGHPHYYLIKDLELLEISIVFAGANRHTRLISIKAIEAMMDAGEFDMARIASDEPSMRVKRQLQILNYDYVPVDVFMALDRSIEKELHIETDKEKSVETETVVDETVVDETVVDGDPGEQKVIPEEILEAFEQIDGLRKAIEEWAGVNTTEPVVETKIVEPDPEREADEALLAQLASLEG